MKAETKLLPNQAVEQFPVVDILKFIFAILIMCLHGNIFGGSTFGVFFERIVVRLAVPFFFVSSGFFYGRKVYTKKNPDVITKRYILRLAEKLLIFEPVSILIIFVQDRVLNHLPVSVIIRESIRHIFFYPRGALWYIQAVIVAILILLPFIKKSKEGLALFLGLILYSFALLCNRYYFLCEGTVLERVVVTYMHYFISARNGVFVGLPYVTMGVLIAKKWDRLQNQERRIFVLLLLSVLGLILEVFLTNSKAGLDDVSLYVAHLVLLPALFLYAGYQKAVRMENHLNTTLLRNLSTSIYLLHSPVIRALKFGSSLLLQKSLHPWSVTFITAMVITVVCTVVYKKQWNPVYNWIK